MARYSWPLQNGQPVISLYLRDVKTGVLSPRTLLADTGAGDAFTSVELILSERDGRKFGQEWVGNAQAGSFVRGNFEIQLVPIELPALGVSRLAAALIIPAAELPHGLDGIAGFRLLNAFAYGNFGDATRFGLEAPDN